MKRTPFLKCMKRGVGWGEDDSSWEPGLVCPVPALTMWPGAESQQLMVSTYIYSLVLVISESYH